MQSNACKLFWICIWIFKCFTLDLDIWQQFPYEHETGTHTHYMIAVLSFFFPPAWQRSIRYIPITHIPITVTSFFRNTESPNYHNKCPKSELSVVSTRIKTAAHTTAFNQIGCVDNIKFTYNITAQLWAIAVKNQPRDTHELNTGCLQEHLGKKSHMWVNTAGSN